MGAPKIPVPGCDLAGQVERVGRNVARFQPGDEVFGSSFMRGFGGLAEWASVSDDLLQSLKEMIEGREVSPVIDRRYSLADAPEAIRYLEEGHARGKVVIGVGAA